MDYVTSVKHHRLLLSGAPIDFIEEISERSLRIMKESTEGTKIYTKNFLKRHWAQSALNLIKFDEETVWTSHRDTDCSDEDVRSVIRDLVRYNEAVFLTNDSLFTTLYPTDDDVLKVESLPTHTYVG